MVYFAEGPGDAGYEKLLALAKSLALPGLVAVRDEGIDADSRPFFAVLRQGSPLAHVVGGRGTYEVHEALGWVAEAAAILAAVAQAGTQLPDADPQRFEVDSHGRLWLADLRGATSSDPKRAEAAHLEQLRALCDALMVRRASWLPPPGLLDRLGQVATLAEAHRLLVAHAG